VLNYIEFLKYFSEIFVGKIIKKEIFLLNKATKNPKLNLNASKYFSRFYKNKYLNAKGSK